MSRRKIDTKEIQNAASELSKLANSFQTEVTLTDLGKSSGNGIEMLEHAAISLQKANEALKELMLKSAAYLRDTAKAIEDQDQKDSKALFK